jgi:5-(carboxyamino)imidazole ribonucleotide synthase
MTTIGIIGAGQLGQMLGQAGRDLGLEFVFLDPSDQPPAATEGPVLKHPFDDPEGLRVLAARADVITYEFENVPVETIESIAQSCPVYPPAEALRHAQDRLAEKNLFSGLGIPLPGFHPVDSVSDLEQAADELGLPVVLKTRRFGYDGKGQRIVRDRTEIAAAVAELGGANLIAEQWVAFDREVSAIGARNTNGDCVYYPLTENEHRDGILSRSLAPADAGALQETANDYLSRLLDRLDYVGVLALELFVVGDELLANEFAPRVHNSGHWTIEGAHTSQFENHLRAILGMAPGDASARGFAGMLNLIGEMPTDLAPIDAMSAHLHDYGKAPRPGRKLGHATVVAEDAANRDNNLQLLAKSLKI